MLLLLDQPFHVDAIQRTEIRLVDEAFQNPEGAAVGDDVRDLIEYLGNTISEEPSESGLPDRLFHSGDFSF